MLETTKLKNNFNIFFSWFLWLLYRIFYFPLSWHNNAVMALVYVFCLILVFVWHIVIEKKPGDFIVPSQSWKFQLKRLTTVVFISWSVFFESALRRPCKDDVINLSLISGFVHFVEGSYFTHTLHLISSIILESFNVMTSFLGILQTRAVFKGFDL